MEKELKIEICGSGCEKFFQTVDSLKKAVRNNRMTGTVEEIIDGRKIAARGRLNLPAVFVNGRLVSQGEGLTPESAGELLRTAV